MMHSAQFAPWMTIASFVVSLGIHGALLIGYSPGKEAVPVFKNGKTVLSLSQITVSQTQESKKPQREITTHKSTDSITKRLEPNHSSSKKLMDHEATNNLVNLESLDGITEPLSIEGLTKPEYPKRARLAGQEGRVEFKIWVAATGEVEKISTIKSSGYSLLDNAALAALRKARYVPALVSGKSSSSETNIAFTFRLTDNEN
ncbi:MAG: TonB family protein [Bdellovibrionales bacterium]|nr:TonB family protein [Bdellovibrionales bacterium]